MKRAIADAVLARAQDHCEACGWPALELALHHRKKRSQGGRDGDFDFDEDVVANIMAVHPRCHDRIHENDGGRSYDNGWLVRRRENPADVPVQLVLSLGRR